MSQTVVKEEKKVTTTTGPQQPQQQQQQQQITNPDGTITVIHQTESTNNTGNARLATSDDPEMKLQFEKQQRNMEGRLQGGATGPTGTTMM